MSNEFACEFVYDDCVRKRVLIRRRPDCNGKPVFSFASLPKTGSFFDFLNEIETWIGASFPPETYTVYREFGMLVVAFDRDVDLIYFKLRWHG